MQSWKYSLSIALLRCFDWTTFFFGGGRGLEEDHPIPALFENLRKMTITSGGAWSIEFQTNGGYVDTPKKNLETRIEAECV